MTVTLEHITQHNWIECISLDLTEEQQQRHAVASNVKSLAQAYAEPWWTPLGVYADTIMVGFVMYGRRPGSAVNYILRLMIDARYQGRGNGKAALAAVIDLIRQHDSGEIELDYDPNDPVAVRLYSGIGFCRIEQTKDGVLARLS